MNKYSFNHYLEHWALHRRGNVALADSEIELTFKELLEKVRGLQGFLKMEIGLCKGDIIGISSPKSVSLALLYLAAIGLGLSVVPLPEDVGKNHMDKILTIIPMDRVITFVGYDKSNLPQYLIKRSGIRMNDLTEAGGDSFIPLQMDLLYTNYKHSITEEDNTYFNLTSGSTGDIKAVRVGSKEIIHNALLVNNYIPVSSMDCYCCLFSPDMHPHELFTRPILFGAKCLLLNNYSLRSFANHMKRHNITHLLATPHTLSYLLSVCPSGDDWNSMKYLIGSGESVSYELRRKFINQIGQKLLIAWGCTETTGIVLVVPENLFLEEGSILGCPIQGYDLRIDEDSSELLIRGECVMTDYWNNTGSSPVDNQGYYHTGDIVEQNQEGLITFVGRRDSFIKAGGRKVSLHELEQQIIRIEGIEEVAVLYSESVHTIGIFYTSKSGLCTAYNEILQLVNRTMQQTKFRIYECSELPKLTSGKINKRALVAEMC